MLAQLAALIQQRRAAQGEGARREGEVHAEESQGEPIVLDENCIVM